MRNALTARMRDIRNHDDERGAAIVAAIGVMIICISLGVLIVSQAIASQRDSGRNRARTVEIHSAEAGVDNLHANLQKGNFVCSWKTKDSEALGPDAVGARAELKYWDADDQPMDCSSEKLVWDADRMPARAKILVTSDAEATLAGKEPVRSFESEVLLKRPAIDGAGAAVFSANGIMTTNGASVTTLDDASGVGNIWVDSGDVNCNSSFKAGGNLFIPNGKLDMSGDCNIRGDVWVSGSTFMHENPARIGGSLWSKVGPVIMEKRTSVGGTVNTAGAFT